MFRCVCVCLQMGIRAMSQVDVREEFVKRVVHMQLNSPDFAEYCVAHVTDPKHRFLFCADSSSAERRLYLRLLQEQQPRGKSETMLLVPSSCSLRLMPGKKGGSIMGFLRTMRDYFASPRMVRGPHMPHMFRTEQELAAFAEMLDSVHHSHESRSSAVQHMVRRLPMTETFLYIICYMCETHVNEAQKPTLPLPLPHDNYHLTPNAAPAVEAALPEATDKDALQRGGTLLFLANMLLLEHEALERWPGYLKAFEFYMERMVETLAKAARCDSEVTFFLRQNVEEWAVGDIFSKATLTRMMQAVGSA